MRFFAERCLQGAARHAAGPAVVFRSMGLAPMLPHLIPPMTAMPLPRWTKWRGWIVGAGMVLTVGLLVWRGNSPDGEYFVENIACDCVPVFAVESGTIRLELRPDHAPHAFMSRYLGSYFRTNGQWIIVGPAGKTGTIRPGPLGITIDEGDRYVHTYPRLWCWRLAGQGRRFVAWATFQDDDE